MTRYPSGSLAPAPVARICCATWPTGVDNGRCVAALRCLRAESEERHQGRWQQAPGLQGLPTSCSTGKDIEAVVIATPLFEHFPVTRDALLAGKHVFCEKSLVFKPEEIHALRALANERSKQILQVGLQRRYSKFYQAAKQMVAKGLIGNVTHMYAQWHRNTFANDPWNKPVPEGPHGP